MLQTWIIRPLVLTVVAILLGVVLPPAAESAEAIPLDPSKTVIVTPANPPQRVGYAAAVLSEWLRKATRSTTGFDIVSDTSERANPETSKLILSVGASRFARPERVAKLRADGYSMLREGNVVSINGRDAEGTVFGVVAFLDKVARVRFYMPGEMFTALPDKADLSVGDLDVTSEPFVASCYLSGIELSDPVPRSWVMLNGGLRRKGGTHQHNSYAMFPPEKYAQSHPEIYPILAGKRYVPTSNKDQSWQLNFLAPTMLDVAEESVLDFYTRNPNDTYASLSINDGYDFSQDEVTAARVREYREKNPGPDARDRATSEIYWEFIAALGERLLTKAPGKRLVCLAYGPTRFPPAKKLPANVVVFTNYHVAELPIEGEAAPQGKPLTEWYKAAAGNIPTTGIVLENGKTPLDNWLEQWAAVTDHLGNHDWYQGSGYLMPRIYSGYWATFLRTLQKRVSDPYMHAECYPNWGLDGPKLWVLTRLWWDPSQDPKKLTRQFCDDLLGPAAEPMAAYFELLEVFWQQCNIVDGPERKLMRWGTQFRSSPASLKIMAEARGLLDAALKLDLTPVQRARVQMFSDCFGLTERLVALSAKKSVAESELDEGVEYIKNKVLVHPIGLHHKHLAEAAWREIYWSRAKAKERLLTVPQIPTPVLGAKDADAVWGSASPVSDWFVKGVSKDPGNTSAKAAHDGKSLLLRITCPHKDVSKLVELDDDTWRSDNVELFFDIDGDRGTYERQMWVKTNGRIVDFSGKDSPNRDIKAAVTKNADGYVVEVLVPLSYARPTENVSQIGLQIVRNEFQRAGMNQLIYSASWTGVFTLAPATATQPAP